MWRTKISFFQFCLNVNIPTHLANVSYMYLTFVVYNRPIKFRLIILVTASTLIDLHVSVCPVMSVIMTFAKRRGPWNVSWCFMVYLCGM